MVDHVRRSIREPLRAEMTWEELWSGPDGGLIECWERGRQKRLEDPGLADRASNGELAILAWKGGVEAKLKYLATWQGLRGEDLDIDVTKERTIVCQRTQQAVVFSSKPPGDPSEA